MHNFEWDLNYENLLLQSPLSTLLLSNCFAIHKIFTLSADLSFLPPPPDLEKWTINVLQSLNIALEHIYNTYIPMWLNKVQKGLRDP